MAQSTDDTGAAAPPTHSPAVLVLHGPNLNMLGVREPGIYGHATLASIDAALATLAGALGLELECRQSNHEGQLVDWIQTAPPRFAAVLINPAAYTHTSVAMRDALAAVQIPYLEVHLSNVHARETFRQHSYFSDQAVGVISGLGADGYLAALDFALNRLSSH